MDNNKKDNQNAQNNESTSNNATQNNQTTQSAIFTEYRQPHPVYQDMQPVENEQQSLKFLIFLQTLIITIKKKKEKSGVKSFFKGFGVVVAAVAVFLDL